MYSTGGSREIFAFSLLQIAWRRKFRILVPALILAAGVAAYALHMPNMYRSDVLLRAEPMATANDFVDAGGLARPTRTFNVDEQMQHLEQIVTSEAAMNAINREFHLYPTQDGSLAERSLSEMRNRVTVALDGGDEVRRNPEPRFVSVRVGFEAHDPDQVVSIANRLVDIFIAKISEERKHRVQEVAGFIDQELNPLRVKLDQQLAAIRNYKQGAATALPEQAGTNLRLLETLQAQYMAKNDAMAGDQARRAAIQQELQELEKEGVLDTSPSKQELSPEEKRLEDLRMQLQEMQTRYSSNHPEVRRIKREIAEITQAAPKSQEKPRVERSPFYPHYLQLKSELQAIDRRAASFRDEQQQITKQMDTYRARLESAPEHESELAQMTRDYTSTQAQYQEMLEKKQNSLLAQRFEKMSREVLFTIVDPARRPLAPYSPKKARIVLLGILAGLSVGIGLAFLAEHMDTAFEGLDDFQRSSELPVIATIPAIHRSSLRKSRTSAPLLTVTDPKSVVAEQYRVLATKMQVPSAVGSKIIGIMSSAGGEGKTLTSVNLALALAATTPGRVLLIDCDLRRPRVHEYLGFEVLERQGLGELLSNPAAEPAEFVRKFRDARTHREMFVIPGTSLGADAVGLLSSPRTRQLFAALRQEFETIILDSPPILPIADSLVLAGLSDEILLIVRARRTPRELFEQAVESLDPKNLRGVVLNDVDYQYSRYAYAYRYYQKNYLAQQ